LETWLPSAWIPPPVLEVIDGPELAELLSKKYSQLRAKWEETKRKLLENRMLKGLNFKKWQKGGNDVYSVRVDDNFRAHLRNLGNGRWLAYLIGTHKEMGHG
jgi:hypothetical protein